MAHEVRGVIARSKGEPVQTETILVPDPGPGEALIQVQACGDAHVNNFGKFAGPLAATNPYSVIWPRTALISCVR